jgi:hypothetical protein
VLFLALVFGFSVLERQGSGRTAGVGSDTAVGAPVLAATSAASPPELVEGSFSADYMPVFLTSGDKDVTIVWLVPQEGVSPESTAL